MDMQPQQIDFQPAESEDKFATELLNDMAVKSGCENEAMYYSDYLVEAHNACEGDKKPKQKFKPVKVARNKMSVKKIGGSDFNIPLDTRTGYNKNVQQTYDNHNSQYVDNQSHPESPYTYSDYPNQENITSNNKSSELTHEVPISNNSSNRTVRKNSSRYAGRKSVSEHNRATQNQINNHLKTHSNQSNINESNYENNQSYPVPKIGKRWCMEIDENGCMAGMYAPKGVAKPSSKMNKGDSSGYQLNFNKSTQNVGFRKGKQDSDCIPDLGHLSFEDYLDNPKNSRRKNKQTTLPKQRGDNVDNSSYHNDGQGLRSCLNSEAMKNLKIPDLSAIVPSLLQQLFGMSSNASNQAKGGSSTSVVTPTLVQMFTGMMQKQSDKEMVKKPNSLMDTVAEILSEFLENKIGYKVDPGVIVDVIKSDAVKQGLTNMVRKVSQKTSAESADLGDESYSNCASSSSSNSSVMIAHDCEQPAPPPIPPRTYKPLKCSKSPPRPPKTNRGVSCKQKTPHTCETRETPMTVSTKADRLCKPNKPPKDMIDFAKRFLQYVEEQAKLDWDEESETEELVDEYDRQEIYEDRNEWKERKNLYTKGKLQRKEYCQNNSYRTPGARTRSNMGRVYREDEMDDFAQNNQAVTKYSDFHGQDSYGLNCRSPRYACDYVDDETCDTDSQSPCGSMSLNRLNSQYFDTDNSPYRTVGGRNNDTSISEYNPLNNLIQNLMTTFLQPISAEYT